MHSLILTAALALAAPVPMPKADKIAPPSGPPPTFSLATVKDGKLMLLQTVAARTKVTEYVTESRTTPDGRAVTVTIAVPVEKVVQRAELRVVEKAKAFDTAGKEIDARRLAELLKDETVVLISADGKPLDPFYVRALKEGTIILALPAPMMAP